jgi:hypothetical protein
MKINIETDYTSKLSQALISLGENIGPIPESFLSSEEVNDRTRPNEMGFDINLFLTVFAKVRFKKDIVLDYAYYHFGDGGRPLIYTRLKDDQGISAREYLMKYEDVQSSPYLQDIIISNDPESFFQLAVFSKVVHQFYKYWHAAYNDHRFIYGLPSVEDLLENIPNQDEYGINEEGRKLLSSLSFEPEVEITTLGGNVKTVMFSKWVGFYYRFFNISLPEIKIETKVETIVEYDSGIRF